jgi:hypothetical protein
MQNYTRLRIWGSGVRISSGAPDRQKSQLVVRSLGEMLSASKLCPHNVRKFRGVRAHRRAAGVSADLKISGVLRSRCRGATIKLGVTRSPALTGLFSLPASPATPRGSGGEAHWEARGCVFAAGAPGVARARLPKNAPRGISWGRFPGRCVGPSVVGSPAWRCRRRWRPHGTRDCTLLRRLH